MNNYLINTSTIAIIGLDKNKSKVIEYNKEFLVNQSAKNIIEESCLFYGSSLNGRSEATYYHIKNSYKNPIVIDMFDNLIFFPTLSPNSYECAWFSINMIKNVKKEDFGIKITFINNKIMKLNISNYSFENQMFKSYYLSNILNARFIKKRYNFS